MQVQSLINVGPTSPVAKREEATELASPKHARLSDDQLSALRVTASGLRIVFFRSLF